jgi:DNA polymerase-1
LIFCGEWDVVFLWVLRISQHLRFQFELLEDACTALGVSWVKLEGYEADDLIATYARRAEENGHKVVIISPDKDMTQLVSPSISVVTHRAKEVLIYGKQL